MLIYITNRSLPFSTINSKKRIAVKAIKQSLNSARSAGKDRIIFGLTSSNWRHVTFYPRGDEAALFDAVAASDYQKPWLVFLHGFHQDPDETVEKAKRLHDIHGVNVVLFSWPSHPLPVKAFDTSNMGQQIKNIAMNMILSGGRPELLGYLLGEVKKYIEDFKNNYEPARRNAENSSEDFYAAMQLLSQHLLPKIPANKLSLVIHSMGNYLLQRSLLAHNGLPIRFRNIVSHQADVRASDHASWLPRLQSHADNKLYITVNVLDYVLAASNLLHRLNKRKAVERLGQSVRLKPEGVYQGYIQNTVSYLDFTDAYGVGIKHEIFTRKGVDINDDPIIADNEQIDSNIVNLLGRIFRGEKDRLPVIKGRSNNSGFSMMPTLPRVYKPTWILEDENLCDEGHDVSCFIRSLDVFEDPFAKEPDYDPDLNDD